VLVSPLVFSAAGLLAIRISPHWHFLGALGPILAALIVTRIANGRFGLSEFAGRMGRWRVGLVWLFVAVFSPILLFVVSAIVLRAMRNPWPDFSRLASAEYANFGWIFGSLLSAMAYGIGEESGWRGFALPRLQKSHSALLATFILSVFWALWHVPMFFYRFEFGAGQMIGFFIGLFAGAIWLTFLYNSTGGSIFIVATWHAIWNIVNIFGLVISVDVISVMSAIVMVAAVVIVIVWHPARLSVYDKHTIPDMVVESETKAA
jgi:membrane protease YdiL (CAAX protease family)